MLTRESVAARGCALAAEPCGRFFRSVATAVRRALQAERLEARRRQEEQRRREQLSQDRARSGPGSLGPRHFCVPGVSSM